MEITNKTTTIITASEGKVLRRKSDLTIYGKTVYLGYNYYESGQLLNERILIHPKISRKLTSHKMSSANKLLKNYKNDTANYHSNSGHRASNASHDND